MDCPVGNNKIKYSFQGSHQWYLKVQPLGSRYPVSVFQAKIEGIWRNGVRTNDNFFVFNGMGQNSFPLSVKFIYF